MPTLTKAKRESDYAPSVSPVLLSERSSIPFRYQTQSYRQVRKHKRRERSYCPMFHAREVFLSSINLC